jgi:general secretion pathway protein A
MYKQFFGLKEKPFEITADPRFLYLGENHKEALAHLFYAVEEKKGFAVVTGEVGTGKTTLVQTLLSRVDGNTRTAYLFNPKLDSDSDFLHTICEDLEIKVERGTKGDYLAQLNSFLMDCYARNINVVLIIDEAQTLSPQLLEEVRLLTNLETPSHKLLQVILVGQPELDSTLELPQFRPLKQRISLRYHLQPLNPKEVKEYIRRRLRVAGARGSALFTPQALKSIYRYSKGIPRLINIVCDNALVHGYASEKKVIGEDIIRGVISDLGGAAGRKSERFRRIILLCVLFAILCGFLGAWYWTGPPKIWRGVQEFWQSARQLMRMGLEGLLAFLG